MNNPHPSQIHTWFEYSEVRIHRDSGLVSRVNVLYSDFETGRPLDPQLIDPSNRTPKMSADHVMDQLGLFWFGLGFAIRVRIEGKYKKSESGCGIQVSSWRVSSVCLWRRMCECMSMNLCLCRVKKRDACTRLFSVWTRRTSYAKTTVLSQENTKNPSLGMGSKFQVSSFRFQAGESHEHLFVEAGVWMWVRESVCLCADTGMGWLRSVGSIKLEVSFAQYCLFCKALL